MKTKTSQLDWQLASSTALPTGTTSRRLYFFNEALPAGARNVRAVYAPVTKQGIVLEGAVPEWVSAFCGSVVRLDDGRYRLYYTTIKSPGMGMAVAESADGLHWESSRRLELTGVPPRQDNVGQPQVSRLPDGRWRMFYWHHQHGWGRIPYLYTLAESDDGLRWHVPHYDRPTLNSHWLGDQSGLSDAERLAEKSRCTNDANFVYCNPHRQGYEQFSQWFLPATPDRRVVSDNVEFMRMIQRRVSGDGQTWSAPELVIQADAHDPWDQQFYHLAVQYHEDWLIGSLGHYRVENTQSTMDLELVFSRDGRRWERPLRGGFIPREAGGRDAEGIYPPNAWIDRGDHWLCLYTGYARKHNRIATDNHLPQACIMAATWAKNRFVGLSAGVVSGGFLTPVFYPQSPEIRLDAAVRGWLRAELCDAWGQKLTGYHLEDSTPITGDDSAHVLRWRGVDTAGFRHDSVRLRLEFTDTDVYGVTF